MHEIYSPEKSFILSDWISSGKNTVKSLARYQIRRERLTPAPCLRPQKCNLSNMHKNGFYEDFEISHNAEKRTSGLKRGRFLKPRGPFGKTKKSRKKSAEKPRMAIRSKIHFRLALRQYTITDEVEQTRMSQIGAMHKAQNAQSFTTMLSMFFYWKLAQKFRNIQMVPFVLEKRLRSSDIACCDKQERLFFKLCLLLSKTQYSLDITANIRIKRFTPSISSKIRIVLEKNISGYVLIKPNIRQKMNIEQSHSAANVKGGPLGFLTSVLLENIKKNEGWPLLETLKIFRSLTKLKKRGSLIVPKKVERGPFALEWFRISC